MIAACCDASALPRLDPARDGHSGGQNHRHPLEKPSFGQKFWTKSKYMKAFRQKENHLFSMTYKEPHPSFGQKLWTLRTYMIKLCPKLMALEATANNPPARRGKIQESSSDDNDPCVAPERNPREPTSGNAGYAGATHQQAALPSISTVPAASILAWLSLPFISSKIAHLDKYFGQSQNI